jgi:hypothetical protein
MKSLITKRRKQNHKISFQFFAAPPLHPRRFKRKGKEIFGFGSRLEGARGAVYSHHHEIRAYGKVSSYHALGACEVNQNPADFAHTMFELRPRNSANFHFCPKRQNVECRKATQNAKNALHAKVFSSSRRACARRCGSSFEQISKSRSVGTTNLIVRSIERCKAIFNFDCPKAKFSIQV